VTAVNKRNAILAGTLVLFLVMVLGSILAAQWPAGTLGSTSNNDLADLLFNDYGVVVLIVGIVLFVSMLGGVYLAQEEDRR
jgi:NADH:ubiquinone oxidoreductase subunit 6 (subunit J)